MKKYVKRYGLLVATVFGLALICSAMDYSPHMSDCRVYRVALGSGTAPSTADMKTIGIRPGDIVVNTDDNTYYLMHATNVYTKITSAGAVTLTSMIVPLASNKLFIGNSSGSAAEETPSGDWTIDIGGTNVIGAAKITDSKVAYSINAAKLATNSTPPTLNLANGTNLPITVAKQTGAITATAAVTPQAPGAVTPIITITPQAPGAVTPIITITKETGAVIAGGANNLVTPTATLTPQTGAIAASGVNNCITPIATITPQSVTPTATPTLQAGAFGISLTLETYQLTNDTALVVTNVILNVANAVTNLTIGVTPDLMTNATCSITPDLVSNSVVAVSVTGGGAVWTNATCAITPDLASNSVVAVTITGGGAVITNVTAASSALPDFATNATATCSALPNFVTNATAAISVVGGGAVVTNATASNP